jgi:hypothetical protein
MGRGVDFGSGGVIHPRCFRNGSGRRGIYGVEADRVSFKLHEDGDWV